MRRLLKYIHLNPFLNDIRIEICNLLNFHIKGNHKDIFLFTSARSGSTLLEKIIASQPGIEYIFEPLNWKRFNTRRTKIQPNYRYIYSDPDRIAAFKLYFDDIFNNKITIHFPMAFWRKTFSFRPERFVMKFINGKNHINWFEENYDIHVVYLIRNPIATTLSRINWGWKDFNMRFKYMLEDPFFNELIPQNLIEFSRQKLFYGNEIEQFITGWSLENYIPLKKLDKKNWLVVSYEELILDEDNVMLKLKNGLNLTNLDAMKKHLRKPSGSESAYREKKQIMSQTDYDAKKKLVSDWKSKISNEDLIKSYSILDKFDLNIYSNNDYKPKLKNL